MPHLSLVGWYHLSFFGALVPYLAVRTAMRFRTIDVTKIDRLKRFRSGALNLVIFMILSLFTAWKEHLPLLHVDAAGLMKGLPAAVAMYVVAVLLMRPRWRKAVEQRKPVVHLFMPQTSAERAWWIVVATL